MNRSRYITAQTVNILGGVQYSQQNTSTAPPVESQPEDSLWGRIKSRAKQVYGYVKQGLQFVNTYVVPVVVAATGFLNAWNKFQGYRATERVAA